MAQPDQAASSSSYRESDYYNVRGGGGEGRGREDGDRGIDNYEIRHSEIQIMEQPQQQQQRNFLGIPLRENLFVFDESVVRDDAWCCVIVVLAFWFFVALTLILGVYGAMQISLGPNASVLIETNPIFVQSIQVEMLQGSSNPGLTLYGLYGSPSLDVVKTWSRSHDASVPSDSSKEWIYFLNKGSQINISYNVKPSSSSVYLVIAEGSEGYLQWLEDPTYPNTTLSWNLISGSGVVQQNMSETASYYVAVDNSNSDDIEVQLDLRVRSVLYDTNGAYYECGLGDGSCNLNILFPSGNYAVLTSPGSDEVSSSGYDVNVSYGPRWATYVTGIVGMTVIVLVAFNFLYKFRCYHGEETEVNREVEPYRAPLLQQKDDDLSSWDSSYDSASNDEKDLEEFMLANSIDGKPLRDGEGGNNTRRLCAVCYDAPRDCFFLPCSHCVACFECGTRIVEATGTCPICRRNTRKVRRIFAV